MTNTEIQQKLQNTLWIYYLNDDWGSSFAWGFFEWFSCYGN